MFHNQFIVTPGYEALQQDKAYVDLSARGRIKVTGEDRARLLHALTTNHIKQMKPSEEVYAFFLTAQGRILSDAHIICYDDHFLLDVEPEVRESLLKHIDHYIIADDVTLEDVTEQTFALVAAGKRIYGDVADRPTLALTEATTEDARTFRVENFHPRFGDDIMVTTLPQETGLSAALHFSKGCYIGQEIVERIRSRGHVNRMLTGLSIDGSTLPSPGTKVFFDGTEAGQITSAVDSPRFGIRAIAMLRTQASKPGTTVQVVGVSALVSAVS